MIGKKEKQAKELLMESLQEKECEAALMMTARKDGNGMSFSKGQGKYLIIFLIHLLNDEDIYPGTHVAVALYLRNHIEDFAQILRLVQDEDLLDSFIDKLTEE